VSWHCQLQKEISKNNFTEQYQMELAAATRSASAEKHGGVMVE